MFGSIYRTPSADTTAAISATSGGEFRSATSGNGMHATIDNIRHDLQDQRKMLDELYVKVGPLESQIQTLREDFESLKSDCVRYGQLADLDTALRLEMAEVDTKKLSGLSAQAINRTVHESINAAFLKGSAQQASAVDSLRQDLFNTTLQAIRAELKHELFLVHEAIQRSTQEASRLAITASECSPDFKVRLMEKLGNKENQGALDLLETLPPGQFGIRFFRMHGEKLGLSYIESDDGRTLLITKVDDNGLVHSWNTANPDSAVKAGDQLVSLNGVSENAMLLKDKLQSIGEINGTFLGVGQKLRRKPILHHV